MKIKKLNTNTVNYLPYQQPIKEASINQITNWYFYMIFNKQERKNK